MSAPVEKSKKEYMKWTDDKRKILAISGREAKVCAVPKNMARQAQQQMFEAVSKHHLFKDDVASGVLDLDNASRRRLSCDDLSSYHSYMLILFRSESST